MSTHAPVIAAVDGSEHSLAALEWALRAAGRRGTEVLAVHVRSVGPTPTAPALAALPPLPVEQDGDPVRERVESCLSARTDPAVPVTYSALESGAPSTALAELAAKAQLLVVGSRGLGGFAALLLGSTGRKLAMQAPCPVVIVPHADRAADPSPASASGRVVLGLAPDETSDAAIGFAFAEAERLGAGLEVVSTYVVPLTSLLVVGEFVDTSDTDASRTLEEAQSLRLAPFRTRHPSVPVTQIATAGDPAGRLVTASRAAALTVVGRHRRRLRPEALVMGSVTNAVLQHAHGPVAVIPGD
ncbi:universal stress protein [Streptomyces sp. NPDC050418]|uniref:universal stress protein n=1 Tax=Streptomyces sp. NPDC050418 TaxID=3365612 RepID=UPI0037926C1F